MPINPLASADHIFKTLEARIIFTDLDGTLVGKGGSLFATLEGEPTLDAARALYEAHKAGLTIVPVSGRQQVSVVEVGRLIGTRDVIAELGTVIVVDGEAELLWGDVPSDIAATPALAMEKTGVLTWLLDRYNQCLEPHEPIPQTRQGTILLRGQLDVNEANEALRKAGYSWVNLVDNGRFNRPFSHLGPNRTHAFHITPTGINKATAVAELLKRKGMEKKHAVAIGDAPADLELACCVGAMVLVANGAWVLPEHSELDIILSDQAAGSGWAEVINKLMY